jgi:hypothetical protein
LEDIVAMLLFGMIIAFFAREHRSRPAFQA